MAASSSPLDDGYIRDRNDRKTCFDLIVGHSLPEDGAVTKQPFSKLLHQLSKQANCQL